MKKIFSFVFLFMLSVNSFAATGIFIINETGIYGPAFYLYFQMKVRKVGSCYPLISEDNPSHQSGYSVLASQNSIYFQTYSDFNALYPGLKITRQATATSPETIISAAAASSIMNNTIMAHDWSEIVTKVSNSATTEGAWIGFWDYYSCHSLPDYWLDANSSGFTTFNIGEEKFFMVTN